MIVKQIDIDGRPVKFGASARTPRLYRQLFQRDVIKDMTSLYSSYQAVLKARKANELEDLDVEAQLSIVDLQMFENLAYVMAKQADPTIPGIDDWLDQFDVFDVYQVLPEMIELWNRNNRGMSIPKKK